ncbi:MAG: hypothetical protein FD149_2667 [Rhodospirillaceae bacterium]|nr:MAG: hypothetical protein FD149_2667 [Rhodospirillaceae bacterium]
MTKSEQTPEPDRTQNHGSAVAALLRAGRMRSGENLHNIAQELHIRLAYLSAIEEGRFHALPGTTYASGFIRAYAEYLGLDGDEVVRRFKAESEGMTSSATLAFPLPTTEGRVPGLGVLLTGVVLAAAAYGVWFWLSSEETMIESVPPVPEHLVSPPQASPPPETRKDTPSEPVAITPQPGPELPVAAPSAVMATTPLEHPRSEKPASAGKREDAREEPSPMVLSPSLLSPPLLPPPRGVPRRSCSGRTAGVRRTERFSACAAVCQQRQLGTGQ